jgi:copper chaperone
MEQNIIKVEGMSCEHCVKAVETAVGALPGIESVSVDLVAKTVTVSHNTAKSSIIAIGAAIEEQGYDVIAD